ncbi:beta-carotene 15,15'-dioxygenase, Brp/Blh family [Geodermatophilus sp. FMUSA9-8]|uniref:beta-carotene 15,15'-dioxygenase, Brp/Blh family n=1 Tax=Geodermatophilus sp. FMUSA9-8 TaxID=3120155 RepID=UPI003008E6C8
MTPYRVATAVSLAAAGAVVAVEVAVGWGDLDGLLLVAGLLLGIPHGAADHVVAARRTGRPVLVALGYAVLAVAAWLAFRAAPGPALLVFVLLSVWHFGTGETAVADLRAGRPVQRRATAAVVLGALVLLVPLARGAQDAAPVLAALVPGSGGTVPEAVVTAVLVTVVPAAGALLVERLLAAAWLEAAEVAVLLLLVLVAPPLAAFGVWFGTWHAVRHAARLVAGDEEHPGLPPRRLAAVAALPAAAALALLAVLWIATDGPHGLLVAAVPLLAALTVPHALVVARLDRARGPRPAGTPRPVR